MTDPLRYSKPLVFAAPDRSAAMPSTAPLYWFSRPMPALGQLYALNSRTLKVLSYRARVARSAAVRLAGSALGVTTPMNFARVVSNP